MRLEIERGELLKALSHVTSVVERRTTIPILSNVMLKAGPTGLQFKATDLEREVSERRLARGFANDRLLGAAGRAEQRRKACVADHFQRFIREQRRIGIAYALPLQPCSCRLFATFERDIRSNDPNWRLARVAAA